MMIQRQTRIGLLLTALAALTVGWMLQGRILAAYLFQSPLPPPSTPCIVETAGGYTLELFGYVDNGDGTTTITYRVTNANTKEVSYVAFGLDTWSAVAPANGSTYSAGLGDYHVEWTNSNGNPGFAGIKYETMFNGFGEGAQETFAVTVSDFDPGASIQVQMKAGKNKTTFVLVLSDPACDMTPTPTPTPTPASPLPTPTATPTSTAPISDTLPAVRVIILGDELFNVPLSEEEKTERWQQGLPVPLREIPDESDLPIQWGPWEGQAEAAASAEGDKYVVASNVSGAAKLAAPVPAASVVTDGWTLAERETFEDPDLRPGGCIWRTGHLSSGTSYQWGRDDLRSKNGTYGWWPAGSPQNGAPTVGSYPDNLQTWWQCEFNLFSDLDNVMPEFELWHELDTVGDMLELRFHNVDCEQADDSSFRAGISWQGTADGVVNIFDRWENYRVFYPSLVDTAISTICIEFKFVSDDVDNNLDATQGPWLDDVQMSFYQKPATSTACQDKDPTVTLIGAPDDGQVSKALVVPPYADDIRAGVVNDPANDLDIAGMVQRLKDADVHWVRLEFIIPPEELNRIGYGLDPVGVSRVDLRHFDRIVDMLCANNIAVLGLVDYQSLPRQDWRTAFDEYSAEFVGATKQLVNYFDDRIRYWEAWNEPNFSQTSFTPSNFARLLIATHDAIKATDGGDQVVFAGLAQAASNSEAYMLGVRNALFSQGRLNPAPYDIFALHPYPSDEYMIDNKVVVDPQVYLHWQESEPRSTTIHKFLAEMVRHGKEDQPLWITEIGWNRAVDNIDNPSINQNCPAVATTMVNGFQQSLYAADGFDILFKETGWSSGEPSVNKIFWYQYVDVGIPEEQCVQAVGASTPSWPASFLAQGASFGQTQETEPNWWFGLYQGIDFDQGGVINPNPLQCVYREYPFYNPTPIFTCHGLVESSIYLPLMQRGVVGQ